MNYSYSKYTPESLPSNTTRTFSCMEVDSEMPLKSTLTGYFLWFLSTNTAVLNLLNGTSKK